MADGNGGIPKDAIVVPHAFQALTLDDVLQGINRLVELAEQQNPAGLAPFFSFVATTELQRIPIVPAWFSVNIIHDGNAGTLFVHVNERMADPVQVLVGETIEVDFGAARIDNLFLQASAGTIACRVWGTR
jgi:hypothetical protein